MARERHPLKREDHPDPTMKRVVKIAFDHILFAERNPEVVMATAKRLDCSTEAALAFMIAEEILEEFVVTARDMDGTNSMSANGV